MKTLPIYIALIVGILFPSCNILNRNNQLNNQNFISTTLNKQNNTLCTGWYYVSTDSTNFIRTLDKTNEKFFINPAPIVTSEHFDKCEIYETNDSKIAQEHQFALSIQIHRRYAFAWTDATTVNQGKRVALIINNKLVSTPMIVGKIDNGASSLDRGIYTENELLALKKEIDSSL